MLYAPVFFHLFQWNIQKYGFDYDVTVEYK